MSVPLGSSLWSSDRHWAVTKVPLSLNSDPVAQRRRTREWTLNGPLYPPCTIEGEADPTDLDFWGAVTLEHSYSPHSAPSSFCFPDSSLSIQQPSWFERAVAPSLLVCGHWRGELCLCPHLQERDGGGFLAPNLSPLPQQLWISPKRETHLVSPRAAQFLRR